MLSNTRTLAVVYVPRIDVPHIANYLRQPNNATDVPAASRFPRVTGPHLLFWSIQRHGQAGPLDRVGVVVTYEGGGPSDVKILQSLTPTRDTPLPDHLLASGL